MPCDVGLECIARSTGRAIIFSLFVLEDVAMKVLEALLSPILITIVSSPGEEGLTVLYTNLLYRMGSGGDSVWWLPLIF